MKTMEIHYHLCMGNDVALRQSEQTATSMKQLDGSPRMDKSNEPDMDIMTVNGGYTCLAPHRRNSKNKSTGIPSNSLLAIRCKHVLCYTPSE